MSITFVESSVTEVDVGNNPWTNPNNALTENGTGADCTMGVGQYSNYLQLNGYMQTVNEPPFGYYISDIAARISFIAKCNNSGPTSSANLTSIILLRDGAEITVDYSTTIADDNTWRTYTTDLIHIPNTSNVTGCKLMFTDTASLYKSAYLYVDDISISFVVNHQFLNVFNGIIFGSSVLEGKILTTEKEGNARIH